MADTGKTQFSRGWYSLTWGKASPDVAPRPPNASPEGKARHARRAKIEEIEENRQLEAELADW